MAIVQFESMMGISLPDDYKEFLRECNGGEGFIGPNAYVTLWRLEEIPSMNQAYHVTEFAPGLLLFGSDGSDTAFGFDLREKNTPIIAVPFIGMSLEKARPTASTFNAFLRYLHGS